MICSEAALCSCYGLQFSQRCARLFKEEEKRKITGENRSLANFCVHI